MLMLMRAEDAKARRLRPYATIAGWGYSSDGKGGMTRPEAAGHQLAIKRAYEIAGFGIDTVGYVEGHNIGIEYRWAEYQYGRLPDLAVDLVRRQVAVIFATPITAALPAKAATQPTWGEYYGGELARRSHVSSEAIGAAARSDSHSHCRGLTCQSQQSSC